MQLHLQTWPKVESYLQDSKGLIFPVGSTEQHGPSGAIGTDAICAEVVAKGVGEKTGALVGPTISVGMALHHASFPGTISLRPATLIALVRDYINCLAREGFERFFFINGHGGNMATLKAAFAETYTYLAEMGVPNAERVRCKLANWFMCGSVYKLAKELYGDREGSHATPSEVSLVQFAYPETISNVPLSPEVNGDRKIYGPADFRRRYPDGRMGSDPSLATPEHGQQFYERAVAELSESYLKFLQEE